MKSLFQIITKQVLSDRKGKTNYAQKYQKYKPFSHCSILGESQRKVYIYKYMTIDTALKCFDRKSDGLGSIRFSELSVWTDNYESRFYDADYSNFSYQPPRLLACCVTGERESEPGWVMYRNNNYSDFSDKKRTEDEKVRNAFCIQIKMRRKEFLKSLNEFAIKKKWRIVEGEVNYGLNNHHISVLHKKSFSTTRNGKVYTQETTGHKSFFHNFNEEKYLSLLLIKRMAYIYENEIRYFAIPQKGTLAENGCMAIGSKKLDKDFIYYIPMDWDSIISEIRVDDSCPDAIYNDFVSKIQSFFNKPITQKPRNMTGTQINERKDTIWISRYDINEDGSGDRGTIVVER